MGPLHGIKVIGEGRLRTLRMRLRFSDSTAEPMRPAPRHGEHSVEVLQEAGFSPSEIDALIALGAAQRPVATAPPEAAP